MNLLYWLSQNSDLVIALTALIAVITSAISVFLTYRALKAQRVHNQISVRPIAHLSRTDSKEKLSIRIENRGIGPLIICSFSVMADGREYTSLKESLGHLPPGFVFEEDFDRTAILPEKSLNLLESTANFANTNSHDRIRKALSKITFKLAYSDIYGKRMPDEEWSLGYFGERHN